MNDKRISSTGGHEAKRLSPQIPSGNPKKLIRSACAVRLSVIINLQYSNSTNIFFPPIQSILEMISDFRDDRSSRTIPDYQLTIFPRRRRVAILKMKMSMFLLSESKEKI